MRRIFACCALSVVLYAALFGFVLDRPLSLGLLWREIGEKSARLAALPSPKIVIIAGSNGPYSHSCVVIGAMLNLPCENAGIAVGIGLDALFARYAPDLRKGDIVYMPMELAQYTVSRAQNRAGPDGALLFRHDKRLLRDLPADRVAAAIFCCTLADFLESLIEFPVSGSGVIAPEKLLASEYNVLGDRIDASLALADTALLPASPRAVPSAVAISSGYGAREIANFVRVETVPGVIVIGGLPVDFVGTEYGAETPATISQTYLKNGGGFFSLPNLSEYPRDDFFNSEDHLSQPCQFRHSIAVAMALAAMLHRQLNKPSPQMSARAMACPKT